MPSASWFVFANVFIFLSFTLFSCALLTGGSVKCWGAGTNGQLGYGNETDEADGPGAILFNTGVKVLQLEAGDAHTCVVLTGTNAAEGTITCWGKGDDGRLGDNNGGVHNVEEPPATGLDFGYRLITVSP